MVDPSFSEDVLIGADASEAMHLAAGQVAAALGEGPECRTVALAGGGTPAGLYALLTGTPWRDRIPWGRIEWFWGDERAVGPDDAQSNYRLAWEALLEPMGIAAERIHRMPADATDLEAAARAYEATIRGIVPPGPEGLPVFDLILLGVGTDGHTASLFPVSAGLAERQRLVVAHEVSSLGAWRMTMTYPLIRAARQVLFLVTGQAKAPVVAQLLEGKVDPDQMPASGIRGKSGRVCWVLDAEAAALVHPRPPA